MTVWRSFGASVIGPSHITSGKPNQDTFATFHHTWGDGIVVSDGLGSKPFSDFGSEAACRAVVIAAKSFSGSNEMGPTYLSEMIKDTWLSLITPLDFRDCAATCLFAFRLSDGNLHLGMLGDGLAAVLKTDTSVISLSENKTEGFSNITTALSSHVTLNDWQWLSISEDDCMSVVLCTDGVADDLTDIDGFIKEFVASHHDLSSASAARRTREILNKWPTPKHSDDKTIACLFREEVIDAQS